MTFDDNKSLFPLAIPNEQILACDVSPIEGCANDALSNKQKALNPMNRVTFMVSGYDNDNREPGKVTEARQFFDNLNAAVPLSFFLEPMGRQAWLAISYGEKHSWTDGQFKTRFFPSAFESVLATGNGRLAFSQLGYLLESNSCGLRQSHTSFDEENHRVSE